MAGGRPTKYTPELIEKSQHYVDNFEDYGDPAPTIAGLSCELKVTRETLHAWARDPSKEEFSYIVAQLMANQERALISGGLKGVLNASISKLMLTKHNYSERVENNHTSSDGSMTPSPTRIELVAPQSSNDD